MAVKQKPLMFLAKTSKTLQLQILRACIEAFHKTEIVKSIEEEFLNLLIECCTQIQTQLKNKSKHQYKDLEHIAQVDQLRLLSIRKIRTKPSYQVNKLRMKKNEAIKLRNSGLSFRELEEYFKIDHTTIQKEMKKWH